MSMSLTRRALVAGAVVAPLVMRGRRALAQSDAAVFGLPIGFPERLPGDGFLVRHGYACENTWYNPGWLHTGEDWYAIGEETAGALIYAVAKGEVVFSGSNYPGLVVIVRHADDLYSMYGHLDFAPAVEVGQPVARGETLGTVLARTDERAPSHLHFEIRTFLTTNEINGDAPRYGYGCGFQCLPGPGYWPIDAPEHPSAMGWRNPTHVIGRRHFGDGGPTDDAEVVVPNGAGDAISLWSEPSDHDDAREIGELPVSTGDRFRLLSVATGREASEETSAEGYRLWYRIVLPEGDRVWVRAAVASDNDTGSDGRPSSVRFDLLLAGDTVGS
jgi:murein DD-endopeptidase MepM/ murein hydrolase activator NlpD